MSTALEQQGVLLKKIARAIFAEVNDTFGRGSWTTAVLDIRVPSDGGGAMSMTRVRLGTAVQRLNLKSTGESTFPLLGLRTDLPGGPWFGMAVIVRRNGNVKVRYDYAPDYLDGILEDDRFYDEE